MVIMEGGEAKRPWQEGEDAQVAMSAMSSPIEGLEQRLAQRFESKLAEVEKATAENRAKSDEHEDRLKTLEQQAPRDSNNLILGPAFRETYPRHLHLRSRGRERPFVFRRREPKEIRRGHRVAQVGSPSRAWGDEDGR